VTDLTFPFWFGLACGIAGILITLAVLAGMMFPY